MDRKKIIKKSICRTITTAPVERQASVYVAFETHRSKKTQLSNSFIGKVSMILLGMIALTLVSCCSDKEENSVALQPTVQVVDEITGLPVSGATVRLAGSQKEIPVNAQGRVLIPDSPLGITAVIATAPGYLASVGNVDRSAGVAMSRSITLRKPAPDVEVTAQGGVVTAALPHGRLFAATIPPGAFDQSAQVSITPLEGIILGWFPDAIKKFVQNTSTIDDLGVPLASFELRSSRKFRSPVTVTFDLPFQRVTGEQLEVQIFKFVFATWQTTGVRAVVDQSGLKAQAVLTQTGRFIVFGNDTIGSLGLSPKLLSEKNGNTINVYGSKIFEFDREDIMQQSGSFDSDFVSGFFDRLVNAPAGIPYKEFLSIDPSQLNSVDPNLECGFWSDKLNLSCTQNIGLPCPSGTVPVMVPPPVVTLASCKLKIDGFERDRNRVITTVTWKCVTGSPGTGG